ncbi:MAG: vancomycin high temperature exclusion protein [Bacteroidetes bacterium]|nr:MAG: vancomycin high temperature exclusion protein [Bacteroidota bacterium]TAG89344.1 MAG: vancomycin high temperature exclusion protein [Bacteroidota bacterium]
MFKNSKKIFFWLKSISISFFFFLFLIVINEFYIIKTTQNFIFSDIKKIPEKKVGVILGTSKKVKNGYQNLFFKYRIDAAVKLYKEKKIQYIIVSGDNRALDYNEPMDMKKALLKHNIPEEVIYLDYAGFRTLDSVIRASKVFGQTSFTIISQGFHNERAVFIAQKRGINAIGFNAQDVGLYYGFRTYFRERFARIQTILDIFIFNSQPKFFGDTIEIGKQKT